MNIHHVCLVVTDMERALHLWRDTLGFTPYIDMTIPDEGGAFFSQPTLDDIFKATGSRSRMVMLKSDEGAKIELQAPETPRVERQTREQLGYATGGLTELALDVKDIDSWFERVVAAGYDTQTDYVWSVGGGRLRSFLFHDADGALIQLVEEMDV